MPIRFGFILLRLFPMYVVLLMADGLRLANKYAGQRVFDWQFLSHRPQAVEASNGIAVECDGPPMDGVGLDYAFVVAGDDQGGRLTPTLRDWLVRVSGAGTTLGAIDSGTFALAEARLIRGRRVTVHPQALPALREEFPAVAVQEQAIVFDTSLITCVGGVATVQLVLALVKRHCGAVVAQYVARDMVVDHETQRPVPRDRDPETSLEPASTLEEVLAFMTLNIENPLSLPALSKVTRLSERQIHRLFVANFAQSPMSYYRRLRLTHAKQLLFQSGLSVSEIAIASGFRSVSAFSRCFAAEFSRSPREMLKALRARSNLQTVPEHHAGRRWAMRAL